MPSVPRTVLVIASNRADRLAEFLEAWGDPPPWDTTVVVWDGESSDDLQRRPWVSGYYDWGTVDALPDAGRCFSRRDSAIKCFGFWKAVTAHHADVVLCLDDDCLPVSGSDPGAFVSRHLQALSARRPKWVPSVPGLETRGLPYYDLGVLEPVVLNMGLWEGVCDLDAPQTLAHHRGGGLSHFPSPAGGYGTDVKHPWSYWPFCAMNFAFAGEAAPLLYFPKMGEGSPYRRFDDIWCGVILQKVCRHLGFSLASGDPVVHHARASHPMVNLVKEAPGIAANEFFWRRVDEIELAASTPLACMREVGEWLATRSDSQNSHPHAGEEFEAYVRELGRYILDWCGLWRP